MPITCQTHAEEPEGYATWFKALWAEAGVYFLFDCADRRITTTGMGDLHDLWLEDVAEVFIWPDESVPVYFEYCISPLGAEIPLIVPDIDGQFQPCVPHAYPRGKRTRKATHIRGGKAAPGEAVSGWSVEFFIPSALLKPLRNAHPERGMTWRANLYRIDYDTELPVYFSWRDVGPSFHNFQEYPTIRFV